MSRIHVAVWQSAINTICWELNRHKVNSKLNR